MADDVTTPAPADEPEGGKTSHEDNFAEATGRCPGASWKVMWSCPGASWKVRRKHLESAAGPRFRVGQEVWTVEELVCSRDGSTLSPRPLRLVSHDSDTAALLIRASLADRIMFLPLAQVYASRELAMAACWQRCAQLLAEGKKARVKEQQG